MADITIIRPRYDPFTDWAWWIGEGLADHLRNRGFSVRDLSDADANPAMVRRALTSTRNSTTRAVIALCHGNTNELLGEYLGTKACVLNRASSQDFTAGLHVYTVSCDTSQEGALADAAVSAGCYSWLGYRDDVYITKSKRFKACIWTYIDVLAAGGTIEQCHAALAAAYRKNKNKGPSYRSNLKRLDLNVAEPGMTIHSHNRTRREPAMEPSAYVLGHDQHVVARGPGGHLRHWWRVDDRPDWRLNNLTQLVGSRIGGNPSSYVSGGGHHVVARGLNGQLLQWRQADDEADWRYENLSPAVGGPTVVGTPIALADGGTQRVYARGPNGDLFEWLRAAGADWQLENLSEAVGGQTIVGDPHAYVFGGGHHIVARGPDGELLEWWRAGTDSGWHLARLSQAVGGQTILGDPHGYVFGGGQHIVARGPDGELLEWWWADGQSGWHLEKLSQAVGGQTILGDPHGYVFGGGQHIVARGPDGELLEWWWADGQSGWHLEKLSQAVGGQTISGDPQGYLFGGGQHIVARSGHDLFEWRWADAETGWRLATLPPKAGAAAPASPVTAMAVGEDRDPRAYYLDWRGHVRELAGEELQWEGRDLTAETGAKVADRHHSLTSMGVGAAGDPRVFYVENRRGVVHELAWYGGGWHTRDLTKDTGAPLVSGSLASVGVGPNSDPRVFFSDYDGHIHELAWYGGGWHTRDLTKDTGADPALYEKALAAIAVGPDSDPRVFYLNRRRDVCELAWHNGGWHPDTLTTDTGFDDASPHSPLAAVAVGEARESRVYYVDWQGHVRELACDEDDWLNTDLTADHQAPAASTGSAIVAAGAGRSADPRVLYLDERSRLRLLSRQPTRWYVRDLTGETSAEPAPGTALAATATGPIDSARTVRLYYLDSANVVHDEYRI